jgi:hypothetical protein
MLAAMENWEISEEDSASDHNIIKFHITIEKGKERITCPAGFRFIIKEQKWSAFSEKLYSTISKEFQIERGEGQESTDELSRRLKGELDTRQFTAKLKDTIQTTCREMYILKKTSTPKTKERTVPWWTDELQVSRKRTNALRRRYQQTTTNKTLRESRKRQYNKAKRLPNSNKEGENKIMEKYCTLTPANNLLNEVIK